NDTGVISFGRHVRQGCRRDFSRVHGRKDPTRLGDGGEMSKSIVLTGKVQLLCGASAVAMLMAMSPLAGAADAPATSAKASKVEVRKGEGAKGEFKVAQAEAAPPPPAADQEGNQVERVTVTGFRGALRSALDKKKSSNTQIDAIKSEDIGKFPDLNLSEA